MKVNNVIGSNEKCARCGNPYNGRHFVVCGGCLYDRILAAKSLPPKHFCIKRKNNFNILFV